MFWRQGVTMMASAGLLKVATSFISIVHCCTHPITADIFSETPSLVRLGEFYSGVVANEELELDSVGQKGISTSTRGEPVYPFGTVVAQFTP